MTTDRERFLMVLSHGPLLRGDAIVVLGGEDGRPRLEVGVQLFRQMPLTPDGKGADLVLSGGLDDHGRAGARTLMPVAMGMGVAPDRIHVDLESTNTRQQAVNVTVLAISKAWATLVLVASPQHLPRAFLTFVKALQESGKTEAIRLVPVAACQLAWWSAPEGLEIPRIELLGNELEKCLAYPEHVATFAEGLAYLEWWERATPERKAAA